MSLQDIQAERAIFALVLCGLPVRDVAELRPEDFSDYGHPHIWAAALSLASEGRPVNHLSLAERLKARGRLAEVGCETGDEYVKAATGPAYLMGIDQIPVVADHAQDYVRRIRECAQRRELATVGMRIRDLAHDPHISPSKAALEGGQLLSNIKSKRPLRMGSKDMLAQQERWERSLSGGPSPYLPVPHEALAEVFPGFVSNLNVVAGRSGGFKTGLVTDCIWHWTEKLGHRGGIIGLEDGTGWAFDRLTAREVGIDYGKVGHAFLEKSQQERYQEWCERSFPVLDEKLFVYDTSDVGEEALASDTPIADWPDVLQEVKRWLAEGVRFIVIDHGLRIRYTSDSKARYDMAIGRAMDTLANLGARHNCAIIVLWHLNRSEEEGKMPKQSDLKESGYLDAAMRACIINWEMPDKYPGQVLTTVVKHTRGAKGVTAALEKEQGGRFGLLHRHHGRVVDFEADRRAEQEAKQQASKGRKSGLFNTVAP